MRATGEVAEGEERSRGEQAKGERAGGVKPEVRESDGRDLSAR